MTERCLQEKVGSCLGCNVLEIARGKIMQENGVQQIASEVQADYCPPGVEMQTRHLSDKSSAGPMRQRR